jgi:uncharacterized protein
MQFNVAGLLREPVGATRKLSVSPAIPPLAWGGAVLVRLPGGVLLRFNGEVEIIAECSRCLRGFRTTAPLAFEEIYSQQVDPATGAQVNSELGGDEAFKIGLDHTIDTTEAVRQYTEMAAAMQPLCRPECPGLCPQCGQDLALGACTCERAPIDSRWAALADLKLFGNG